jgi:hypothetical protein
MKVQIKYLILTLTAICFTLLSTAQEFRFGFKASPSISWVKSNSKTLSPNGSGIGFSYGLMGDFGISDNYAFSTEILVTDMRSKFTMNDTVLTHNSQTYSDVSLDYKTKYLQIPLSLKMKTGPVGKSEMVYYGQFGIAPSFLISSKVKVSASPGYIEGDFYNNNSSENDGLGFNEFIDDINFVRIPMILGAGIEYPMSGNTSLVLGVRFDNSFIDMLDDKKREAINNYLGLNIGVFF